MIQRILLSPSHRPLRRADSGRRRRGIIVPLVALLITMLFAMVAFSVDIGYISKTRQELQNAADAAALAGAVQLLDRSQLTSTYSSNTVITAAQTAAKNCSSRNFAGAVSIQLPSNGTNSSSGDIVCGNIARPTDRSSPLVSTTVPYNAVQVITRRDSQMNQPLSLFFAPLLGISTTGVTATSTAAFDWNIKGFRIGATGAQNTKILPFALNINTWKSGIASGPDVYKYNATTRAVTSGADGVREVKLYPYQNSAGNFGTVNLGQTNNSTSILNRQILEGPNASDLANMGGQIALGSDGTLNMTGNPGLSAAIASTLTSIIGQPRIILLYDTVSGVGAGTNYRIVGFAGVIVEKATLTGLHKGVVIQPEFVQDTTAYGGGSSNSQFVYTPIQLCR